MNIDDATTSYIFVTDSGAYSQGERSDGSDYLGFFMAMNSSWDFDRPFSTEELVEMATAATQHFEAGLSYYQTNHEFEFWTWSAATEFLSKSMPQVAPRSVWSASSIVSGAKWRHLGDS